MLAVLVGGWGLLPNGPYPHEALVDPIGRTSSMHAMALPVAMIPNKGIVMGLGCLVAVLLCDRRRLGDLRPSWLDLALVVWCLTPLASALANGLPFLSGFAQVGYLALAWGVPYLMGRLYLSDESGMRRLAMALTLGGLVYGVPCLLESINGPFLYRWIYGPHPYQLGGADRPLGFRPLVFLEHGTQLGMWTAGAAVAGAWMVRTVPNQDFTKAIQWVGVLVVFALIGQSHGSVVLMALALVPVARSGWTIPRRVVRSAVIATFLMAIAVSIYVVFMLTINPGGLREQVRGAFLTIGKSSLTWRLARFEELVPRAAERPLVGWGVADWSPYPGGEFVDPVGLGLWLMTFGRYGVIGLVTSTVVLVAPILGALRRRWPGGDWTASPGVASAVLLLSIHVADSVFNSVLILPMLAAAGGLNTMLSSRPSSLRWTNP
jgi:hypothetical protein